MNNKIIHGSNLLSSSCKDSSMTFNIDNATINGIDDLLGFLMDL